MSSVLKRVDHDYAKVAAKNATVSHIRSVKVFVCDAFEVVNLTQPVENVFQDFMEVTVHAFVKPSRAVSATTSPAPAKK